MRKWLNRLFVFLVIPVLILSLCVPSVGAVGLALGNQANAYHTYWSGNVNVYFVEDSSTDSAYWAQIEIPAGYPVRPGYDDDDRTIYNQDVIYSSAGASINVISRQFAYSYEDIYGSFGGDPRTATGFTTTREVDFVQFVFDPVAFNFSREAFVNNLYFVGSGTLTARGLFSYIANDGAVINREFSFSRTIGGGALKQYSVASWITGAQFDSFFPDTSLIDGRPCMISNFHVTFDYDASRGTFKEVAIVQPVMALESYGQVNDMLSGWHTRNRGAGWFIANPALISGAADPVPDPDPDVAELNFVAWLGATLDSVFAIDIFGEISIGDILFVCLGVSVVFWLLKMFAGG